MIHKHLGYNFNTKYKQLHFAIVPVSYLVTFHAKHQLLRAKIPNGHQGSISPTFYEQLLGAKIPKA